MSNSIYIVITNIHFGLISPSLREASAGVPVTLSVCLSVVIKNVDQKN